MTKLHRMLHQMLEGFRQQGYACSVDQQTGNHLRVTVGHIRVSCGGSPRVIEHAIDNCRREIERRIRGQYS